MFPHRFQHGDQRNCAAQRRENMNAERACTRSGGKRGLVLAGLTHMQPSLTGFPAFCICGAAFQYDKAEPDLP
jgi:hypothetical protein